MSAAPEARVQTVEEMREAILELAATRERERRARAESEFLVRALEIVQAAPAPDAALAGLLSLVREAVGCDAVVLLREDPGRGTARAGLATDPAVAGGAIPLDPALANLFRGGVRRILDLAEKDWWRGAPDSFRARWRALLFAPVAFDEDPPAALACFGVERAAFTKDHERLVARVAALAAQSVRMLELAERNRLLATVVDKAEAGFAVADARDAARPILFVNETFGRLAGIDRQAAIGAPLAGTVAAAEGARERAAFREAVEAAGVGEVSLSFGERGAQAVRVLATVYPVTDRAGAARFVVASFLDVSAEREYARQRDEAEERLAAALEAAPEAMLIADRDGRVVLANERYCDVFPARRAACAAGTSLATLFAADAAEAPEAAEGLSPEAVAARRIARFYAGGEREEALADGRILLASERPTADGGAIFVGTDITRLKAIEALLAQRAAAMDAASDGIAIADTFGRFVYMNRAHARLFGHDAPIGLLGAHWSRLYGEDDRRIVETEAFAALRAAGSWQGELTGVRKDGTTFEQEVSLTTLEDGGIVCVTRDSTERRRVERERARLKEQLHEAQRREAIGQLSAGIAHDFNNLLSAIGGSAALVATTLAPDHAARPHLERIDNAVSRASALVRRLLAIGRRGGRRETIDLRAPVREAAEIARTVVPASVRLAVEIPERAVHAPADATEISQIVLNLLINARDALPGGTGRVRLRLETVEDGTSERPAGAPHAHRARTGTLGAGVPHARIVVEDVGIGIPPDRIERLFDPYFTTKGEGSGLGLAVTASIVRAASGSVEIASTPGAGTRVVVRWPLATVEPVPVAPPAAAAERADLAGALVLVVEDDPDVCAVIARILEDAGAEVAACESPVDALEVIEEHPDDVAVVVTDYDLPEMSGTALAERVRAAAPAVPVVVCTALAAWRDGELSHAAGIDAVVEKPVDPAGLVATLGRILAARANPREASPVEGRPGDRERT